MYIGKKVLTAALAVEVKCSARKIRALTQALVPETTVGNKCAMKISRSANEDTLLLHFSSCDLVSLRASFNTNLRLVSASLKMIEAVSNFSKSRTASTERLKSG
ncbi:MAG: KEOPS complex subunit Pcc1 [Nitrososphaerales archaeon]